MANLYTLPSGKVNKFTVVIEIPEREQNKFEYSPEGYLELDRVLYGAAFYPASYGFIPSTKAEDGDAVDVMVFLTNPVPAMTVIKCRAIGMIEMVDSGEKDSKILAVPLCDPRFDDVLDLTDLPQHKIKDIVDFFVNMQKKKDGEWVTVNEITGIFGKEEAEVELAKYLETE